jgi:hypothetical protein
MRRMRRTMEVMAQLKRDLGEKWNEMGVDERQRMMDTRL